MDPDTYYLPAALSSPEELDSVRDAVHESGASHLFADYPIPTMVLDAARRLVWANERALGIFGRTAAEAYGLRPGEAIGCVHWCEAPGGCGTGAFCALCGFARNLEVASGGETSSGECMIKRNRGGRDESLDLLVWTRPVKLLETDAILVSARDISDQKRREVLERVFYHDIANTAAGIIGIVNVARPYPEAEDERYFELLRSAATQLAEEVDSHKTLKAAEDGDLPLNTGMVDGRELAESAVAFFAYSLFGKNLSLTVDPASDRAFLETDPVILKRILVNMIKNALEAAEKGESVVVRCSTAGSGSRVVFTVRNRAVMPEEAKQLVFQRSFSTKGIGRGVGTYGMKLLAERFLRGAVGFSSRPGEGTVFYLDLPAAFPG